MSSNVSRLNFFNTDSFKLFGQQIINESKTTLDKANTKQAIVQVPIVEEKKEDENTGLDVVEINNDETKDVKSLANTTNVASDIYDDIKNM